MKYYSEIKKTNEWMIYAKTKMNLKGVILSKTSLSQEATYSIHTFMWYFRKEETETEKKQNTKNNLLYVNFKINKYLYVSKWNECLHVYLSEKKSWCKNNLCHMLLFGKNVKRYMCLLTFV